LGAPGTGHQGELMKLPRLGPRGEGWVVAQLGLGALVVGAQWVGPRGPVVPAIVVVMAGLALLGWAIWALGRALTPFPRPRQGVQRVRRGPYRFLSHPMYVAAVVVCAGAAIHAPMAAIPTAILALVLSLKARVEEEWLDETARELPGASMPDGDHPSQRR
jgi:protein-S-isoprenylcysteine O-methyltransferase Ste14